MESVATQPAEARSTGRASDAIVADSVSITYRDEREGRVVVAVEDLNLTVPRRAFVSIIGPSGCGKSTFLRSIGDLNEGAGLGGSLLVNGVSPLEARRNNNFAFVFQDAVLLPWRRASESGRLPLEVVRKKDGLGTTGRTPEELLQLVGLAGFE